MRQGIESIPSSKQQRRHYPSLLSVSFLNARRKIKIYELRPHKIGLQILSATIGKSTVVVLITVSSCCHTYIRGRRKEKGEEREKKNERMEKGEEGDRKKEMKE